MKSASLDRLHLGCGLTAPSGWLNVDGSWQVELARYPRARRMLARLGLIPAGQAEVPWARDVRRLDLRRPLPFAAESFDVVFSSHLLEHLYRTDALRLLRECHRVLRPGGVCRAVVPDLGRLVSDYLLARERGDAEAGRAFVASLQMRPEAESGAGLYRLYQRLTDFHTHKWMYDAPSLVTLFREAGFPQPEARAMWDSRIENVREVESESRAASGVGICVEAVRS